MARSLVISLLATVLSGVAGIPLGVVLATSRFPARDWVNTLVNTGMGLPPVVVGLVVSIFLWRTGPFGALQLIYTPAAMVLAQFLVAAPIATGFTRSAIEALEADRVDAFRVCGASGVILGRALVRAALPGVVLAIAAAFGRAIAEVGASLMVGGNIAGQTRVLTTAITHARHQSRGVRPCDRSWTRAPGSSLRRQHCVRVGRATQCACPVENWSCASTPVLDPARMAARMGATSWLTIAA